MTRAAELFTLVSFHAHPDDEVLLTGGLLARSAAAGHRVVLVAATAGERGSADARDRERLGDVRGAELVASAEILGCARVVALGYADSGLHPGADDSTGFAQQDVARCAEALADVLREERADVLTIYDANGGYGHPDHVQVHRVGVLASQLAGTPVVLEATVPGRAFSGALRALSFLGVPWAGAAPLGTDAVFSPGRAITHRVRVGGVLHRKRAAMAAHASQRRGEGGRRALDRVVRLPLPLFWVVFGREWYVEHGRRAPDRLDDVFASLRGPSRPRDARRRRTRARRDR